MKYLFFVVIITVACVGAATIERLGLPEKFTGHGAIGVIREHEFHSYGGSVTNAQHWMHMYVGDGVSVNPSNVVILLSVKPKIVETNGIWLITF